MYPHMTANAATIDAPITGVNPSPPPSEQSLPPENTPNRSQHQVPIQSQIRNDLTWWVLGGILLVLAAFALVALCSPASNKGIKDAASALALITATAVGIERILEVFWNFVDTTQGSFWPLTKIDTAINELVESISTSVTGPLARLKNVVSDLKKVAYWSETQVADFPRDVDAISERITQLKQLAPTSDNAQAIAAYVTHALAAVAARYPQVKSDVFAVTESVNAISDFVNTLTDNPGRRILSIYAGALMGLAVAVALGLDMFNATLGTSLDTEIRGFGIDLTFKFGVAATGIVVGLGSSPTHELIKVLQTFKEQLKSK